MTDKVIDLTKTREAFTLHPLVPETCIGCKGKGAYVGIDMVGEQMLYRCRVCQGSGVTYRRKRV